MTKRKTALGLAVLFALALSAFAASSASASGATAITCVKEAGGPFNGDHCLTSGSGNAKHVTIPAETTTTGTVTNANTAESTTAAASATLKGALAGVVTELTCSGVTGEGTFENKTTVKGTGEMFAHVEGTIVLSGCVVKAPAGKGCKINGGSVTTGPVTGKTLGTGEKFKVTPKEGTTFTEIKIEGCSIESLNNTFPVTGSFETTGSGATDTATHASITAQNTLKFGGVKAGLEGALTFKAHSKEGEATTPTAMTFSP